MIGHVIEVVRVIIVPRRRTLWTVRNVAEALAIVKNDTNAVDHEVVIVQAAIARVVTVPVVNVQVEAVLVEAVQVETVQVAIDMVAATVVISIEIVSDVIIDRGHEIAAAIPDRDIVVAPLDRPENWWTTRNVNQRNCIK